MYQIFEEVDSLHCWLSVHLQRWLSYAARFHASVLPTTKRSQTNVQLNSRVTSSSDVAKRPRNASCLSVVGFIASIVQYLERSFLLVRPTLTLDLPVSTIQFCSVVFIITSSLAVIHRIHGRPWLCIVGDRAWSVSHCTATDDGDWLLRMALGGPIPAYPQ